MTREEIMRVAGSAQCDPRTVSAYADGRKIKPLLKERIEAAIKRLKIRKAQ